MTVSVEIVSFFYIFLGYRIMRLGQRLGAEIFGTFWLVLGGCGAAVLAAGFPQMGIGFVGVAFAFGLTVLTMAYAIGHISGCHLNPAVTVGLTVAKRFPVSEVVYYIISQVIGGIIGAGVIFLILNGKPGFDGLHPTNADGTPNAGVFA